MTAKLILAVEDSLSQAVAVKMLAHVGIGLIQTIGLKGNGYLKSKAPELNRSAVGVPVLMLTDRDTPNCCPAGLATSWIGGPRNPNFLFRVAEMEIESWVLADHEAFAKFSGIAAARLPATPDAVGNPKQALVNLFRKCRNRSLRLDIVPADGSTTSVGPAYNARLIEFVEHQWSPMTAATRSPSLERALRCALRFKERAGV